MAGSFTKSLTWLNRTSRNGGDRKCVVTLVCTSDALGACSDDFPYINELKGLFLLNVRSKPSTGGTAPSASYTGSLKDADAFEILAISARSDTNAERVLGDATLLQFPLVADQWTFAFAGMGDSKVATFKFEFCD